MVALLALVPTLVSANVTQETVEGSSVFAAMTIDHGRNFHTDVNVSVYEPSYQDPDTGEFYPNVKVETRTYRCKFWRCRDFWYTTGYAFVDVKAGAGLATYNLSSLVTAEVYLPRGQDAVYVGNFSYDLRVELTADGNPVAFDTKDCYEDGDFGYHNLMRKHLAFASAAGTFNGVGMIGYGELSEFTVTYTIVDRIDKGFEIPPLCRPPAI
ncbi:MAG: hypothetical protein WD231_05145 [Candidatus Woykebacteria bacterium]